MNYLMGIKREQLKTPEKQSYCISPMYICTLDMCCNPPLYPYISPVRADNPSIQFNDPYVLISPSSSL